MKRKPIALLLTFLALAACFCIFYVAHKHKQAVATEEFKQMAAYEAYLLMPRFDAALRQLEKVRLFDADQRSMANYYLWLAVGNRTPEEILQFNRENHFKANLSQDGKWNEDARQSLMRCLQYSEPMVIKYPESICIAARELLGTNEERLRVYYALQVYALVTKQTRVANFFFEFLQEADTGLTNDQKLALIAFNRLFFQDFEEIIADKEKFYALPVGSPPQLIAFRAYILALKFSRGEEAARSAALDIYRSGRIEGFDNESDFIRHVFSVRNNLEGIN